MVFDDFIRERRAASPSAIEIAATGLAARKSLRDCCARATRKTIGASGPPCRETSGCLPERPASVGRPPVPLASVPGRPGGAVLPYPRLPAGHRWACQNIRLQWAGCVYPRPPCRGTLACQNVGLQRATFALANRRANVAQAQPRPSLRSAVVPTAHLWPARTFAPGAAFVPACAGRLRGAASRRGLQPPAPTPIHPSLTPPATPAPCHPRCQRRSSHPWATRQRRSHCWNALYR